MFSGSIPALVTPFKDNRVDETAFVNLVERQIAAGSSALVPCGTTGESATLTHDEHMRVVELCVETAKGRVPVIAGCGSNATHESIGLLQHAKAVGADAALVVCPYYNRPDQDGMYLHFSTLNDAVDLPIFLYNVPARTSSDLLPDTVGRLAKLPNIIGIKDASADLARVPQHQALCGEDFILLSGEDPTAIAFNAVGGVGCISVTANVAPEACARVQAATLAGDFKTAREINLSLIRLHRALFMEPSPAPSKYALSTLGLCEPEIRSPLHQPSEAARKEIEVAMAIAGVTG